MRNALGTIYTYGDQLSLFSAEKQAKYRHVSED